MPDFSASLAAPAIAGVAFALAIVLPLVRRLLRRGRLNPRVDRIGGTAVGYQARERARQARSSGQARRKRTVLDRMTLLAGVRARLALLGYGHFLTSYVLLLASLAVVMPWLAPLPGLPGSLQIFVWLAVLHIFADRVVLEALAQRRRQRIMLQIPVVMDMMSRMMRVGRSIEVSFGVVAQQIPAPLGQEFAIIERMVAVGAPTEVALRNAARNVDLPEFDFFVASYVIHLETGGDLTGALEALSETVRERINMKSKTEALVMEAKMSGYMVGVLPIGLLSYLSYMNPEYMAPLFETPTGQLLLTVAGVILTAGVVTVNRLTRIRI